MEEAALEKRSVVVGCLLWAVTAGAQVSVQVPADQSPTESGLSPPILAGASNCSWEDWRISLTGGLPGATYEIVEGAPGLPFYQQLGEFPVAPNTVGATVVDVRLINTSLPALFARQKVNGLTSGFSAPLFRRDPSQLPAPELPLQPIWTCGAATIAQGHQPGDQVELLTKKANGWKVRSVIPSAFGTSEYMPAGGAFVAGEIISLRYSTCEGPPQVSPEAPDVVVATNPMTNLLEPELQSASLVPSVPRFTVTGVEHGATLTIELKRGGTPTTWTEVCASPVCTAFIPTTLGALAEGDLISVSQALCVGTDSPSVSQEVKECGDGAPPQADPAPQPGDIVVRLSQRPLASVVRVYVTSSQNPTSNLELLGYAFDTSVVPLARAITEKDLWVVIAVDAPSCPARNGTGYFTGR